MIYLYTKKLGLVYQLILPYNPIVYVVNYLGKQMFFYDINATIKWELRINKKLIKYKYLLIKEGFLVKKTDKVL